MYKQGEKVKVTGCGHPGIGHSIAVGSVAVVLERMGGGFALLGPHRKDGRTVEQIVYPCHIEKLNPVNANLRNLLERDY